MSGPKQVKEGGYWEIGKMLLDLQVCAMAGKSGKSVIKTLEANGWEKLRQSGSHVQMGKDGKRTTVPKHDELKKGTLAKIQRDTGIKF